MLSETILYLTLFAIWLLTFVLTFAQKNPIIPGIGGIVGIVLGIELISSEYELVGAIIIVIAFYQLYKAAFEDGK